MKTAILVNIFVNLFLITDCKIIFTHKLNENGANTIRHHKNSTAINPITDLALKCCQESFKWEKWNCPSSFFYSKNLSKSINREQAFVTALKAAYKIYSKYMECSRKSSDKCDCLMQNKEGYGSFKVRDIQAYADLHNIRAGKLAVQNSLKQLCRCHGMSGSCSVQTCWKSLNAFSIITYDIKQMYHKSKLINLDNFGNILDFQNIHQNQLVFLAESPNYCIPNIIPDWKGTINRRCAKGQDIMTSKSEKISCKNLCKSCGLNVKKRHLKTRIKCNFKFDWQSTITYEFCEDVVDEYYCGQ